MMQTKTYILAIFCFFFGLAIFIESQPAFAYGDLWTINTRYPHIDSRNGYRYTTPNVSGVNYRVMGRLTENHAPIYAELSGTASVSRELGGGMVEITISDRNGNPLRKVSPLIKASIRPDFFTTRRSIGPRGVLYNDHEVLYNSVSVNSRTLLGMMDLQDYVDERFDEYYSEDVDPSRPARDLAINEDIRPTGTITPLGDAPVLYTGSTTTGTSPSPVMDTSGVEASSVMGALSGSSYCSDSARMALSSQREKTLQDKENMRTSTFSDVLNLGSMSCFDMYQLTMFNDVGNTLSNSGAGGGFFSGAISNVASSFGIPANASGAIGSYASGALSDYLSSSICEAYQNFMQGVQSSFNGHASALYSSVQDYQGNNWWGKQLGNHMPELDDKYFESATLGSYYDYGSDFLTQAVDTYSDYRQIYQDAYDSYDPDGGQ